MIEEILDILYKDKKEFKGTGIMRSLLENNEEFRNIIIKGIKENKINGFSDEIWNDIETQNIRGINSFTDVFRDGANLGYCTVASKQLSYSLPICDIVGGVCKYLVNTTNSTDGSHTWIEMDGVIYDTTYMLEIDKSYKGLMGYIEENRYNPNIDSRYCAAKEFTNDPNLRTKKQV